MNGHNHYHNGIAGGAQESLSLLPQSPMTSATTTNPLGDFLPPEIPLSSIRFLEELGEGQFGKVWKGELMLGYTSAGEEPMQVKKSDQNIFKKSLSASLRLVQNFRI